MSEHQPFVHLHVHSEYSLLDGLSRINDLVARAKSLNQPALALTDHGAMYGVIPFYRACKAGGIKPIIGIETYVASRTMRDRDSNLDKDRFHLLLLAQNQTGYQNLLKIASAAQLEGYYYRPRVDHDFLAAHADGLIATTGCLAAEIPRAIDRGQIDKAHQLMRYYLDVFGPDRFFIELQEHDIPQLVTVNNTLMEFAQQYNLRFLATNDVHYTTPEEAVPHDVLLCIQTSATVQQQNRMRLSNKEYYLKSHAEMAKLFGHIPGALENSLLIAEQCDINLDMKGYHLPIFDVPEGFTPPTYLRHLCEKGLAWRYGEQRAATDEELRFRLDHELNIIGKMGFETYFLIVWDLGEFARRSLDWWIANGERFYPGQSYEEWKENDIWWNVRGSGAGSVVAYTLGITGIDPLANGLIFERFLNPGRVSMPDIDLDYPDDRRHEMVEYAMRKYGSDKVAQIITFGTLGARAAIRDVARAMDVPLAQVDEIAKMIPAIPGKPVTIANVLDKDHEFYNAEFEALYKTDEAIRNLIKTAQNLEGVARHASSHAAGVIISDKPLVEYVPLNRPTSGEAGLGGIDRVTQWPMEVVESIGLLKVDFLGLSTLTVLRTAARLIEQRYGTKYQMDNIPYDVGHVGPDPTKAPEALFDMLGRGEVQGVFQVEGAGMRRLMMEMRPRRFDHIIAAISLYRPGPMEQIPTYIKRMHGIEEVQYHVPDLESILGDTYGICVSGDSLVMDARTGQRYRLDEVGKLADFVIQGVDEQWRPATGRVVRWIDSGHKQVYQVTLRNGAQIKVTADHRLLTEAGWRPLCELQVGDYIGTPPHLLGPAPEDALPFDQRQLRVLAYLIADGSLASMAAADFVSKDAALLTEYQHCLEAFAGVKPSFTAQVRGVTRIGAAKESLNGDVHYHTPNSLLAWLRQLGLKAAPGERPGGLRSHEKFIPPFVFGLDDEAIAFFLASLWDCDGYVGKRLCHYKTVSPQLAEGVQTLLLRLGIRATVYQAEYMNGETHRIGYQVTVYDTGRLLNWLRPHLVSVKKDVSCAGKDDYTIGRDPFISEVDGVTTLSRRGLMAEYGIDRQHFYPRGRQRERISAQVVRPLTQMLPLPETARRLNTIWEEIIAIEPAGVEHVYDLTVEGLHSFVANNIIVHNCVYQEQIIQMASKLAGYEPGEADMIRKAVSKKKRDLIDKHRVMFTDGGVAKGYPREAMEAIWGDIEFFARYGFNKSHAADYAVITCQTAFLKAHYPVEYMAALLSVDRDKSEKVAKYLAEARRLGIQVAPPDVNTANLDFTIEDTDKGPIIRYGMGAIKNAGESAINVLLEGRRTQGPFKDLDAFCDQVDLRRVGKRALEAMIKVGVFDQWGTRPQLLDALDRMMGHSGKTHDAAAVGQMSLFGMLGGSTGNGVQADLLRPPTEVPAIDHRQLLDWEKELIGVYLSEHPLARALNELKHVVTVTTGELDETKNGREVTVAGLIAHLRPHTTKKGDAMAFGSLEDLEGKVDLLFFPRTWKEYRGKIKVEQVVVIRGKVQAEQDSVTIVVDKVQDNFTVARSADEESYIPPADEFSPDWLADAPDDEPFADELLVNGAGLVSRPQARNGHGNGNGHGPKNGNGKPTPSRIAEPAPVRYTPPPPPPPNFEESEQWAVSSEQSAVSSNQLPETSGKELVGTQRNSVLSTQHSALITDQSPVSSLSVSQSPQPRHVVIEIAAAANWRDIIRQVYRIASQHQGADPFTLSIPEKGHRMTFPNLSTHYSPELLTALRQVPGVKNVLTE